MILQASLPLAGSDLHPATVNHTVSMVLPCADSLWLILELEDSFGVRVRADVAVRGPCPNLELG